MATLMVLSCPPRLCQRSFFFCVAGRPCTVKRLLHRMRTILCTMRHGFFEASSPGMGLDPSRMHAARGDHQTRSKPLFFTIIFHCIFCDIFCTPHLYLLKCLHRPKSLVLRIRRKPWLRSLTAQAVMARQSQRDILIMGTPMSFLSSTSTFSWAAQRSVRTAIRRARDRSWSLSTATAECSPFRSVPARCGQRPSTRSATTRTRCRLSLPPSVPQVERRVPSTALLTRCASRWARGRTGSTRWPNPRCSSRRRKRSPVRSSRRALTRSFRGRRRRGRLAACALRKWHASRSSSRARRSRTRCSGCGGATERTAPSIPTPRVPIHPAQALDGLMALATYGSDSLATSGDFWRLRDSSGS
ncbi:hypothetical protein FA95DRAFT_1596456 [Auriscalpium vulgare]|uniref:Uncharacterized protein n=1 Tax=Auriscalpium vulgare TaxID=40419 RepID=A0ACB8RQ97_9AGAM|nr:hypothetical protein FA95DRAFT_1596456 [Auriscalpium vulgare]